MIFPARRTKLIDWRNVSGLPAVSTTMSAPLPDVSCMIRLTRSSSLGLSVRSAPSSRAACRRFADMSVAITLATLCALSCNTVPNPIMPAPRTTAMSSVVGCAYFTAPAPTVMGSMSAPSWKLMLSGSLMTLGRLSVPSSGSTTRGTQRYSANPPCSPPMPPAFTLRHLK